MQVYTNSKRQSAKTIFALLVIMFIAYLPASTFLFFIKNDAFNGYFPPKFFMSESLHSGYIPLWNPYINFGIPQYGDMSSAYWNPITWLIAGTTGYNAYTFTIELLLYIFIGGLGMYKLMKYWNVQPIVRIIAAVTFMCCGYNVGHLQHFNWLSGTAFLPWCLWFYLLLQNNLSLKNILFTAIAFYLFISAAHPGLIIGAFYFFLPLSFYLFFTSNKTSIIASRLKLVFLKNIFFLIALIIISAGLIIGYLDILPYFSRGEKVMLASALQNPTSVQSWISFILPFSSTQNDSFFATDISMRNIYISITLFFFLLITIISKKDSWQKFFLITGILFLLLASGGIFKTFAYKFIPLISFVRLDGEFVIFSILCFIIIASIQLNKYITQDIKFEKSVKWIYYIFELIVFAIIVFGLYKMINAKQGLLYSLKNITAENEFSSKLKTLINAISFYDTLWMQGSIQLIILSCIKYSLRKQKWNLLVRVVIADVIISTLLNLPFTGVGQASVKQVQIVLNKSPKGIPVPLLQPIVMNDTLSKAEESLTGDWSFYNKQIGVTDPAVYPITLKNVKQYLQLLTVDSSTSMMKNNFLFSKDTFTNNQIHVLSYNGN